MTEVVGNGGNLSFGCRWLIDFCCRAFINCVVVRPETGYFPFDNCNVFCLKFDGCFGITNAVCFSSDRSLHKAEISGKSKCLLCSRSIFMSIAVDCGTDVELTGLIGSLVANFIDAFVRGKVVVIGWAVSRGF